MADNWRLLFKADELEWFIRLGKNMHDPQEKRFFFESVLEAKRENPYWNLFEHFPKEDVVKTKSAELAKKYGDAILETLKGRRKKGV